MKTLIELYDERPIDNVLATEMFRPRETVFVCPPEIAENRELKRALNTYFVHRGCPVKLRFVPVSLLDAVKVEKKLQQVLAESEDCALDISGGTDAALFAAGAVSGGIPVITYSHNKNCFYEIKNAPFARALPCTVRLDAASCFLMAGGTLQPGRGDSQRLRGELQRIDRLFAVYCRHRNIWNKQISYLQKISGASDPSMQAEGPRSGKADNGIVHLDASLLTELADEGLIQRLQLDGERVSFRFADELVRFWLRDMGSVLELHVFRACLAAGCFDDVVLSAVVNWDGAPMQNAVTNEIDVMAVRGIHPLMISCKTCEIRTEALNELAILRDRFGGKGSRAMIVTSASPSKGRTVMRRRAAELGIEVVEWNDLPLDQLVERLRGA